MWSLARVGQMGDRPVSNRTALTPPRRRVASPAPHADDDADDPAGDRSSKISLRSWPLAIGSHPSQRGVMTLPAGAGVQSLRNMFDGKLSQSMRGMSSRAFSSRSTSGGTSPGGGGGGGGHRGAAKASRSAACAVS